MVSRELTMLSCTHRQNFPLQVAAAYATCTTPNRQIVNQTAHDVWLPMTPYRGGEGQCYYT